MGWFAFALVLILAAYFFWRIWRGWILPWREVEAAIEKITNAQMPGTFLISGAARARGVALALEKLALRQHELLARVEEGEFDVQTIVGALPDGLVVVDKQRRIRLMNDAFRRFFSAARSGESFLATVRDPASERSLGEALARGASQRGAIVRNAPEGSESHLDVILEPIRGDTPDVRGAVVLFRDVTEVKQTEALRRDFVANVSHELRTPLSILRGYLETLLEEPGQPPAELLRIFETMERHSRRLNLLVEDILSLARLEAPGAPLSLTSIRLSTFLRGILRDWEKKFASKNLEVELDAPEELPLLEGDEGRLEELVYNLLDNAVRYSSPGGRIVLRAARAGEEIALSISDTGIGIAARDLPRIFERFYRADKSRQRELGGTGLGLSIVKHIAQLHGARVEAESELGVGTTIKVIFPATMISAQTGAHG